MKRRITRMICERKRPWKVVKRLVADSKSRLPHGIGSLRRDREGLRFAMAKRGKIRWVISSMEEEQGRLLG